VSECIFCQIVAGQIPNHTVYEDETTLAFLDVNPLASGHTLVIPKEHGQQVADLPELAPVVLGRAAELAPAVRDAVGADGTTIAVNDGPAAGQEVPHLHVHIVPRTEADGAGMLHALDWPTPEPDTKAFEEVRAAVRERQDARSDG
jgi:histidine triad (HIT) family protein